MERQVCMTGSLRKPCCKSIKPPSSAKWYILIISLLVTSITHKAIEFHSFLLFQCKTDHFFLPLLSGFKLREHVKLRGIDKMLEQRESSPSLEYHLLRQIYLSWWPYYFPWSQTPLLTGLLHSLGLWGPTENLHIFPCYQETRTLNGRQHKWGKVGWALFLCRIHII